MYTQSSTLLTTVTFGCNQRVWISTELNTAKLDFSNHQGQYIWCGKVHKGKLQWSIHVFKAMTLTLRYQELYCNETFLKEDFFWPWFEKLRVRAIWFHSIYFVICQSGISDFSWAREELSTYEQLNLYSYQPMHNYRYTCTCIKKYL